ncbi:hypothetical protein STEG23_014546 [Scotinomys teguina]
MFIGIHNIPATVYGKGNDNSYKYVKRSKHNMKDIGDDYAECSGLIDILNGKMFYILQLMSEMEKKTWKTPIHSGKNSSYVTVNTYCHLDKIPGSKPLCNDCEVTTTSVSSCVTSGGHYVTALLSILPSRGHYVTALLSILPSGGHYVTALLSILPSGGHYITALLSILPSRGHYVTALLSILPSRGHYVTALLSILPSRGHYVTALLSILPSGGHYVTALLSILPLQYVFHSVLYRVLQIFGA